jgi:hypothetical protein
MFENPFGRKGSAWRAPRAHQFIEAAPPPRFERTEQPRKLSPSYTAAVSTAMNRLAIRSPGASEDSIQVEHIGAEIIVLRFISRVPPIRFLTTILAVPNDSTFLHRWRKPADRQ